MKYFCSCRKKLFILMILKSLKSNKILNAAKTINTIKIYTCANIITLIIKINICFR